jgi:hypothetical protein
MNLAAFTPDNKRLLCTDGSSNVSVFDIDSGELAVPSFQVDAAPKVIQIDPAGKRLAVAWSGDKRDQYHFRIWDIASGTAVTPIVIAAKECKHFLFTPDSRVVITALEYWTADDAIAWDAGTGEPLCAAIRYARGGDNDDAVVVRPDGRMLYTRSKEKNPNWHDQEFAKWSLAPDQRSIEELQRLGRVYSGCKIVDGEAVPLTLPEYQAAWRELRGNQPAAFAAAAPADPGKLPAIKPLVVRPVEKQRPLADYAAAARRAGLKLEPPLLPIYDALLGDDVEMRRSAVATLAGKLIGEKSALVLLTEAIRDRDDKVQREAVATLGKSLPAARQALPALIQALGESEGQLTQDVAWVIGKIGPDAKEAVPHLAAVLDNQREYNNVKAEAGRALGRIGSKAVDAVPALVRALASWGNRRYVAALVRIGQSAQDTVVDECIKQLGQPHKGLNEREDESPHLGAMAVLRELGPRAARSAPALRKLLADNSAGQLLRAEAANALWKVTGETRETIAALIGLLRRGNDTYTIGGQTPCGRAALTLDAIGPDAREAIPELEKLFKSTYKLEAFAAAGALWSIDRQRTSQVLPALIDYLKAADLRPPANWSGTSEHRPQVLAKLERMGPEAKPAVPVILQLIKEDDAKKAGSRGVITWYVRDEEDREEDQSTIFRRAALAALRRIDAEATKEAEKR